MVAVEDLAGRLLRDVGDRGLAGGACAALRVVVPADGTHGLRLDRVAAQLPSNLRREGRGGGQRGRGAN